MNSKSPSQSPQAMNSKSPSQSVNATDQWHLTFTVPEYYSTFTEDAIASGRLTRRNRTEIIQSLSSSMMVFTKSPTSEQYNTVCRKLIEKFSKLKDGVGKSGYVSICAPEIVIKWLLSALGWYRGSPLHYN